MLLDETMKKEKEGDSLEVLQQCKTPSLGNSTEQGSTLRDLLTSTAGRLKLGSTDAGIAFAPVYSTASQVHTNTLILSKVNVIHEATTCSVVLKSGATPYFLSRSSSVC